MKPTHTIALFALACLSAGQASLINVNFTGGTAVAESSLEGPAGGLGTSWNQYDGADSTGAVVDSTGAATTVTIDTNFGLTAYDGPTPLTMLRGSMTDFGKGADNKSVTISGLAIGGTYDIWLVTLRNQPFGSDGTEQYVGWWSTSNTTTSPGNQLVDAVNATINTSTFVEGYNYVLFENVVANESGEVVFTGVAGDQLNGSDNNHRLGLNGLQIRESDPPVAGPVDDSMSTVGASPASVLANGVSTSTVTVSLKDAAGIGVPGKEVTLANTAGPQAAIIDPLSALTTNASGEVSFSVSSNTPGIEVFTATVVTDSLTLTDTASVEFTGSGAPLAFNVNFTGNESPLPAESGLVGPGGGLGTTWNQFLGPDSPGTLLDSTGAGSTVTIDTNFDLPATLDGPAPLTLLRGSATNFGKGVDNTNVTIGGLEIGAPYDVWLVTLRNQPFGSNGTEQYAGWWSTANPTSSPGDQFVDARGVAVNTSTFVEGYNFVLFEDVVADGGGNITFTGVAGTLLDGSDNLHRLGLNGLQILEATPPVAGPVDDAMSTVIAFPDSALANGVSTSTVTVTLKDAAGIGVPGKEVTLANTSGPQAAIIDPFSALTTNASGEVSFSVSSSTAGTEVFTATVVTDSLTLTDTASVEFTDPATPVAFNVNFHAGTDATGLVGVVGGSGETWNQGTTSLSNLIDTTGTVVSSVSVSGLPSGGSPTTADLNVFDANRNFFGKGQDTTISITGLIPDTAYDLYLYALSHNVSSWGDITSTERAAGDFVATNTVLGNGQSQWLDNGIPGTGGSAFVANGNYVAFESVVADGSGNISILVDAYDGINGIPGDGDGDCRLHISGLQIRPASGMSVDYMTWRNSYPGLGLPDEDDDGDGWSNDYERIFGMDPTDPASSSPYSAPFDPATGSFGYTRRSQSLANLGFKVWYSTDLEEWFEDNAAVQTTDSVVGDVELMGVSIDPALLSESKLFLQVRSSPVTGVDLEPSLVNLWGSGNTITLLFSEPMNPSSAGNPANYTVDQDGVGSVGVTGATLSSDGGSVTLTLDSALGTDTAYTVGIDGVTSGTGQSLGSGVNRQFTTWDDDPNGIKVFILAGQSNMVGFGSVEDGASGTGTIGSLRYLAANNDDPAYDYYDFTSLLTDPGDTGSAFANRSDVRVWWKDGGANLGGTVRKGDLGPPFKGSDTGKIGPEYAFGQVLGDFYPANNVLIIKCAWGGRDLAERFRPPSAVARVPGTRVGEFYSAIIDYSREVLGNLDTEFSDWSGQGYQIVGFGWHQGYNDRINTAFSNEYKDNLPDLISDVREVFNKPDLPFVIASTGMDTGAAAAPPYSSYSAVERAQLWVAGVPQPANVLSTDTRPFWRDPSVSPVTSGGQGFHWNWNAETLFLIGKSMGDDMVDLLTP